MSKISNLVVGLGLMSLVACTPGLVYLERGEAAYTRGDYDEARDNSIDALSSYREASGLVRAMTSDSYKERVKKLERKLLRAVATPIPTDEPTPKPTATVDSDRKYYVAAGCDKEHNLLDLIRSNPYSVKGKCFGIQLKTRQILSRNQGLYGISNRDFGTWAYNDVGEFDLWCFLDFGVKDAPVQVASVIAKGTGVYRYVTVSGAEKIIPKLKVVYIGPATR